MENNYNFQHKCPSVQHYQLYLNNEGDADFKEQFTEHLSECHLCAEAIDGYKVVKIGNIEHVLRSSSRKFKLKIGTPQLFKIKYFQYAASIVILLGITVLFFGKNRSLVDSNQVGLSDYSFIIETPVVGVKTLTAKTSEQFIYINSCNRIAYNDQFISTQELKNSIKKLKNVSLLRIEVAMEDNACATEIINEIKRECSVPVLTISNSKSIKKLTS
ncbi:MAG: hypothetical protein PF517_05810 [Salinivirgaceae bacterium]|jgi:hypothetical protein|nr:hypothetical protein [Salinivirgaceae bacterium]